MDRNHVRYTTTPRPSVALRKESVDRNQLLIFFVTHFLVALRKESVDRNRACIMTTIICTASLSARRAWIEIPGWPGDVL